MNSVYMSRESPSPRDNMRILTLVCSTFVILGSNDAKPVDDDDDRLLSAIIDDSTNPPGDGNNGNGTIDGGTELLPTTSARNGTSAQNRTAHARMSPLEDLFPRRTTSTLMPPTEYDYWWRFTTPRRPRYRDFPGKPGVATWKEISPGKRDSKTASPTAAEVLSGAPSSSMSSMTSAIMYCALLILIGHHELQAP